MNDLFTRVQTLTFAFDGVFLLVAFQCVLICNYCFFIVVNKISIYLSIYVKMKLGLLTDVRLLSPLLGTGCAVFVVCRQCCGGEVQPEPHHEQPDARTRPLPSDQRR